jgi:site-specific DNA-methyltransferase (adenine-specific)
MNFPITLREEPAPYQAKLSGYRLALADRARSLFLYHGNCLEVMAAISEKHPSGCFDMIFADPPYGLSNDGFTCVAGRIAPVNKGEWDKFTAIQYSEFTREWLSLCQKLLKRDGTLWVSGTRHNIFQIGALMEDLGYKLLNDIVWEKPNPPPNLSCRYFTHSTETLIWAAKNKRSRHRFNYAAMKADNGGKQMKSVWRISPPGSLERMHGKHPTQKPLALLSRIVRASTVEGDFVLDPFSGSSTTGVAAKHAGRAFCGIESELDYVELSKRRLGESEDALG